MSQREPHVSVHRKLLNQIVDYEHNHVKVRGLFSKFKLGFELKLTKSLIVSIELNQSRIVLTDGSDKTTNLIELAFQ